MTMAILIKATVLLCGALAVVHLSRRCTAAVRHAVIVATFVVLATLPITHVFTLPVYLPGVLHFATAPEAPATLVREAGRIAVDSNASNGSSSWRSRGVAISVVWVIGAVLFALPVFAGLWQSWRWRRGALPDATVDGALRRLARNAGMRRTVIVGIHRQATGPLTCGFLRPIVILPADATEWAEPDLTRALCHELEHVRRWDWLTCCAVRIVCACYWFHPLVWFAWRRLVLEAERACDDAVLRGPECDAEAYANQLLVLAERQTSIRQRQLAMAGRGDLARRVRDVLSPAVRRGSVSVAAVARITTCAFVAALILGPLRVMPRAQSPSSAQDAVRRTDAIGVGPRFDVASIRQNRSGDTAGGSRITPGGGLSARNETVLELIQVAYGIDSSLIQGAPRWISSNGYDIEAKPASAVNSDVSLLMLRALLVERFQLRTHWASQEVDGYVLARVPGRTAPKPAATCDGPICGGMDLSISGRLTGRSVSTPEIAQRLGRIVGRPVIDQSGLSGTYDVELEWAPERSQFGGRGIEVETDTRPSLYTAVSGQLGLTLQSARVTQRFLVIDSINLPSED